MPRYEYHCQDNGQCMIVRHCQSESIRTWGELCQAASAEVGSTPADAVVEQRAQMPCTCGSDCSCHDDHHDDSHHHNHDHSPLQVHSPGATSEPE